MGNHKIPMTAEQHRRHGARLKAAHLALTGLFVDLGPAVRRSARVNRLTDKTVRALAELRYELEDMAVRDCPGHHEVRNLYSGASREWLEGQQEICRKCHAPANAQIVNR